ncbi:MAG: histidine phosphatase family protein [Candidatus Shapirobacteria bacterium]|jgi:broad specificity phosphatase PhoE
MIRLILIRHAESERNAGEKLLPNRLTNKGQKQAKQLARYLADNQIDFFYCSNTPRSMETLEEIIKGRGGEFDIALSHLIKPKTKSEKFEQVKRRTELFIEDLKIEFEKEATVAVISHKIPIQMMLLALTGKQHESENGSVSVVEISETEIKPVVINQTEHLNHSK